MKQPTEEQIAEIKAQAIGIAEGWAPYEDESLDYDEVLRIAWQYLVDTGAAWKLQGWFGVLLNPSSTKGSSGS